MTFIGELAALFTSFCWSLSAIGFTKSTQRGKRVTSPPGKGKINEN